MSEEQWTTIGKQLDDLSDLFRRRLLDDRAARDARQFLEKRIAQLESALSADDLRPTVRAIAQVVTASKTIVPSMKSSRNQSSRSLST